MDAQSGGTAEYRSKAGRRYGESARGLLAAATAVTEESPTKEERNAVPNAFVLVSPALNVEKSASFIALAGKRQDVRSIELGEHVRRGPPPTMILTGALDRAIPPVEFCEKIRQARNRCELEIYPGVGHKREAAEENSTAKENAAKTRYDAYGKAAQFLGRWDTFPCRNIETKRIARGPDEEQACLLTKPKFM
jgi:acetyl esterase/lipase